MFNGLDMSLGNLCRLSDAKTRSISAENPTGGKGCGATDEVGVASNAARDLGKGWKISPYIRIESGKTAVLADIEGPGAIQHIWLTALCSLRHVIIRFYWDGSELPAAESPVGDFFACSSGEPYRQLSSLAVCVNPRCALNCYWQMPFRRHCRITLENIGDENAVIYYQIDYTLTEVPEDCAYFCAQFRRVNPLPYKQVYTLLDGVRGKGQYVGTYMLWGVNNCGWWGEGEIKFYIDGDGEYPTVCGTGTEDYFCGSYGFDVEGQYREFCTPYAGMYKVIKPDGCYKSQQRFALYRWHITDPVRFDTDLKVTMQALGWRSGGRYLPLQDDISSVSYWYQTLPTVKLPPLPTKDELEII